MNCIEAAVPLAEAAAAEGRFEGVEGEAQEVADSAVADAVAPGVAASK